MIDDANTLLEQDEQTRIDAGPGGPGDAGATDELTDDGALPPRRDGLPTRDEPADRGDAPSRGEEPPPLEVARRIVDLAADKKAADIVLLDVRELTTVSDYFVICSGASERQLGAISDGIAEGMREEGVRPLGREGGPNAHWLLLDFGSVIVHIFAPPERDYYGLEKLWSAAPLLLRMQ